MNIPINKDFERDYKDSAWKGYSLKELKYLVSGVAVAVLAVLFFWLKLGIPVTAAIYIGVPVGAPVIFAGFIRSKNGLSLWQNMKAIRYRRATAVLFWKAGEYDPRLCQKWQSDKPPVQAISQKQKRVYRKFIKACHWKEKKLLSKRMKQIKKAEKTRKGEGSNEF